MFAVRPACRSDISAVDALLARAYPRLLAKDYAADVLQRALPVIGCAQPDLVASGTYYLIEEQGSLLGAGGWTRHAPGSSGGSIKAGLAHIRHVVVDDRAVRRGIARCLLEHIFTAARADGCMQLHCLSTLTAEPFYAAMGFAQIKPVSVDLGPDLSFPAIEMTCDF